MFEVSQIHSFIVDLGETTCIYISHISLYRITNGETLYNKGRTLYNKDKYAFFVYLMNGTVEVEVYER